MDKEVQDKIESTINQYLAKVAKHNPFALPDALLRTSVFRITLVLLGSFIDDFDESLRHLENELRTLLGKENPNDR